MGVSGGHCWEDLGPALLLSPRMSLGPQPLRVRRVGVCAGLRTSFLDHCSLPRLLISHAECTDGLELLGVDGYRLCERFSCPCSDGLDMDPSANSQRVSILPLSLFCFSFCCLFLFFSLFFFHFSFFFIFLHFSFFFFSLDSIKISLLQATHPKYDQMGEDSSGQRVATHKGSCASLVRSPPCVPACALASHAHSLTHSHQFHARDHWRDRARDGDRTSRGAQRPRSCEDSGNKREGGVSNDEREDGGEVEGRKENGWTCVERSSWKVADREAGNRGEVGRGQTKSRREVEDSKAEDGRQMEDNQAEATWIFCICKAEDCGGEREGERCKSEHATKVEEDEGTYGREAQVGECKATIYGIQGTGQEENGGGEGEGKGDMDTFT